MGAIVIILLVFFVYGLFSRNKGDNVLDTLSSGAKGCLSELIIFIIITIIVLYFHYK